MKPCFSLEINKNDFVNRMCEIGFCDASASVEDIDKIWDFLTETNPEHIKNYEQFHSIISLFK